MTTLRQQLKAGGQVGSTLPARTSRVHGDLPDETVSTLPADDSQAEARAAELIEEFDHLVERWHGETDHLSDFREIVLHPAFQRIIGMGELALPMIFHEMRSRPGHWSWALQAITGENPVPVSDRSDLGKAAAVWLAYGAEQGYL